MRFFWWVAALFCAFATGRAEALTISYEYERVLQRFSHDYVRFEVGRYGDGTPVFGDYVYDHAPLPGLHGSRSRESLTATYADDGTLTGLTRCFSLTCFEDPLMDLDAQAQDFFVFSGDLCGCYTETIDLRAGAETWSLVTDDSGIRSSGGKTYFYAGETYLWQVENLVRRLDGDVSGPTIVATPLPAGLPLSLAGLAAFGLIRRQR